MGKCLIGVNHDFYAAEMVYAYTTRVHAVLHIETLSKGNWINF